MGVGDAMKREAWLGRKWSRKRGPKNRGKVIRGFVTRNSEDPLGLVTVKRRWDRSWRGREEDEDVEDDGDDDGDGDDDDGDEDDDDDDGDDDDELTPVEGGPTSFPPPPSLYFSSEKSPASSKGASIAVTSRCKLPSTAPP
jgi:hypothetical protein